MLPDPTIPLPEPFYAPITALINEWAERTPTQTAVIHRNQSWTYAQLAAAARRIAHNLLAAGLQTGDVVAIHGERRFEFIAGMIGTLQSGGVLLNLPDTLPNGRLQLMLRESAARFLLYTGAQPPSTDAPIAPLPLRSDGQPPAANPARSLPIIEPDAAAYIFFTSGTTGTPKGVLGCHKGMAHFLDWQRKTFNVTPQDRGAQLTGLSFDVVIRDIFLPLTSGAALCLPDDGNNLSPQAILPWMDAQKITLTHTVPTLAKTWLANLPEGITLTSLRCVFFAGEPLTDTLINRWRAAFPQAGEIVNLYGPTETTLAKFYFRVPSPPLAGVQPVGSPQPQTQGLVLGENGRLCAVGEAGEIVIRTPFRTLGYINGSDADNTRFAPNPFRDDPLDLVYYTGDLGKYRPDGSLDILGRVDHQVKIRGVRIEPAEIEAALNAHTAVWDNIVLARQNEAEEKYLTAYLIAEKGQTPAPADLRHFLRQRLPDAMIPAAFVVLDAFPMTQNNKIDRRVLPAPTAEQFESGAGATAVVAPSTPLQNWLLPLWQETLNIDRIGVNHDFFALGGDSIRGAILINRVQEALGATVHIVAVFDAPTIAQFAAYLEREYPAETARLLGQEIEKTAVDDPPIAAADIERFRRLIPALPPFPATGKNPRAIFILSPPRSGSTLLRVVLGGHSRLFAPPELKLLSYNTLQTRREAFSGRYRLFREGAIRALMQLEGCDADEAWAIMEGYENDGLSVQQFYGALQGKLNGRLLVDKSITYSLDTAVLQRAEAYFEEPLYIHLTRHPYGMVYSYEEARLDQISFMYDHDFSRRRLAELIWLTGNQNILDFLATVPASRQHRLQYETFTADPETAVRDLCRFLDVDFEERMLQPYDDGRRRMTDGLHAESRMIGDPKFHNYATIDPTIAERWRKTHEANFLGAATLQLAETLGYRQPEHSRKQPETNSPSDLTDSIEQIDPDVLLTQIDDLSDEEVDRLLSRLASD